MPWARFDDRFPSNRKIRRLSDAAFRLYVSAICWSAENLTDGFVADDDLPFASDVKQPAEAADELTARGLWERLPDGWFIHDYFDYNPRAAQVRADRAAKNARQQRWRERVRGTAVDPSVDASTAASTDASRDESVVPPVDDARASDARLTKNTNHQTTVQRDAQNSSRNSDPARQAANDQDPRARDVDASRDAAPTRPDPTPITTSSSPADAGDGAKPKRGSRRRPPERFDDFWSAYPRRVGKIDAQKAYARALAAGATPDELIAGASFYAMEKKLTDPKYVKHPATWLNGGCWQDEPDPAYTPPVITGPSEAASAMPRPFAELRTDPLAYGRPTEPAASDPWPDLDFGRMPG